VAASQPLYDPLILPDTTHAALPHAAERMMAAAYGPELAASTSAMDIPGHLNDPYDSMDDEASVPRSHDSHAPPPNPHFVFPARLDSPSTPSVQPRASGRRPMSVHEQQDRPRGSLPPNPDRPRRGASVALPAFSFNPGASLPPAPSSPLFLSPPTSPYSPNNELPSPARPTGQGHRRGGSEFVGGRLREGNSIAVMSTSPTRSESGSTSPNFQPPKRGHRRGVSSAAISIADLPTLSPPFDMSHLKGSSAPTSPTNFDRTMEPLTLGPSAPQLPEPAHFIGHGFDADTSEKTDASPKDKADTTKTARSVGFSDKLEFIPRPLSMVSSDTSSIATARPGHSLSGSISSIVSAASPSGRESPAPLSRSPTKDMVDSRPSTAGAILERTAEPLNLENNASPKRRNSIPTLLNVAEAADATPATPSPSKTFKRWSFFGLDSFTTSSSPIKSRPSSSSSSSSTPRAVSVGSSEHGSESAVDIGEDVPAKASKKNKKNKKKSKGWTGSILPRKSKGKRSAEPVRPPTPPAPAFSAEEESDTAFPELQSPVATTPTVTITESAAPTRRREDSTPAMIDLDAALGPFNTPLPHNPEWEAAQRAAGNVGKRRLHSAQGLKGFSGPGMHYHRRAESAPDLPPFDPGSSAIHRFGSSSTMADVFEEDEEDEESGISKGKLASRRVFDNESDGDVTPPAAPQREFLVDREDTQQAVRRKCSSLSDKAEPSVHSIRAERSRTSLQDKVIIEEHSVPLPQGALFHGSTNSGDSALQPSMKQDPSSVDGTNPAAIPISPYSMSHASSFPSPRSPVSVDAQRISTAPSSINDETNFQSLLMGEPGPEVRLSIDYDIPSLTSSNSTMTRDSAYTPNLRTPRPGLRDQRPVSVSSAFGRRRSSLASLSRLISSSHGERSKLSMEVTPDDPQGSKSKTSRTKRLSKLMQFWKTNKQPETS
jgi:hypothetical protein